MMSFLKATTFAGIAATAVASAAQSPPSADAPPPSPPPATKVQPPKAAPDMQKVLDALTALNAKPVARLTPAAARVNPSAADAAKKVMQDRGMPTAPDASVTTRDMAYGTDPQQFVRVYTPASAKPGQMMPMIVYYHGGGGVIATVDTYDAAPRLMAKSLDAVVASVEYRHAPEAKFPAQHDDAAAAYRWVLDNAKSLGGDPTRLAVAGESAGGNLAVATAIHARDNKLTAPKHIVSIYPIANSRMDLPSRKDSANAKPLDTAMLSWFGHYYGKTPADQQDPRINLVAANLRGLPPTTIINAQIDPLRSDGETLATAMRTAGVKVEQRTFPAVTHEMFGMGAIVKGAKEANDYALGKLTAALVK